MKDVLNRILTPDRVAQIKSAVRGGFWMACVVVLWGALAQTGSLERHIWDKALHFTAFYGLATLAAIAWPALPLRWIGFGLLGFGLAIEGLQKLPFIHRDASWGDFFADGLGIGCALAPIALERLRRALL